MEISKRKMNVVRGDLVRRSSSCQVRPGLVEGTFKEACLAGDPYGL